MQNVRPRELGSHVVVKYGGGKSSSIAKWTAAKAVVNRHRVPSKESFIVMADRNSIPLSLYYRD